MWAWRLIDQMIAAEGDDERYRRSATEAEAESWRLPEHQPHLGLRDRQTLARADEDRHV